jgi:selenocysteine-specific elongation factor
VSEDLRAALAGTPLAGAPIVETSAVTGAGLDALRAAIAAAADALPARDAADLFRMPVDRAFTVKGTGTVVTGTVWSGTLAADGAVRVLPLERDARVRGIETHGAPAAAALPGTRAAIALSGVDVGDVARGATLVTGTGWHPSRTLLAEVALLDAAPRALGPRTKVRFHLGTQEIGARIVCVGGALQPGARAQARIALDQPAVARAGDRFVIRGGPSLTTIGGGIVNDPAPATHRAKPWPASAATPAARLAMALDRAGRAGIAESELPVRLGATPADCAALVASLGENVVHAAGVIYHARILDDLRATMIDLVNAHHVAHPLDSGAPIQSIRERLAAPSALVDAALRADGSGLLLEGPLLRRPHWRPELDPGTRTALVDTLRAAGREPPSVAELDAKLGQGTAAILRLLEREQLLVQVEPDRWYSREAVDSLVATLRSGTDPAREYSPAELRDLLGFSRKFLIPFLEWCDRTGITIRRAHGRSIPAK